MAEHIALAFYAVIVPPPLASVFFRQRRQLDTLDVFKDGNSKVGAHRILTEVDLDGIKSFRNTFFVVLFLFSHKYGLPLPTIQF
jgi:hypothetical protein